MGSFCSLAIFWTITTIVSCSVIPKRVADYHSHFGNPLHHNLVSLINVGRTNLITTVRDGYTFDDCANNTDCRGDRFCFNAESPEMLCGGADACFCRPQNGIIGCTNSEKCDSGEICALDGDRTFPRCLSSEYASKHGRTIVTSPPGDGFSRDLCSDTGDCQGDRICRLATDIDELCEERDPCFCILRVTPECCFDADCVPQEVCAENTDFSDQSPLCISPFAVERESNWERSNCSTTAPPPTPTTPPPTSTTPPPTPTTSQAPSRDPSPSPSPITRPTSIPTFAPQLPPPPCIAVHQLGHIPESELVFQKHPWSKVLCDVQTSCATPGHMIVYKDQPMMMSTYCRIVGCVTRVMQVNSPRYRRKQSVPSMTGGLEFTSFAARYETSLEQYVFTLAVRMGL